MDLSQASNAAGISADPKLGEGLGLIGVLSEGRVDRLAYTKQAVTVCMIGIDRDNLY
jgi:non-canonical (house-cleaning) NTP pyrophosphatase